MAESRRANFTFPLRQRLECHLSPLGTAALGLPGFFPRFENCAERALRDSKSVRWGAHFGCVKIRPELGNHCSLGEVSRAALVCWERTNERFLTRVSSLELAWDLRPFSRGSFDGLK